MAAITLEAFVLKNKLIKVQKKEQEKSKTRKKRSFWLHMYVIFYRYR